VDKIYRTGLLVFIAAILLMVTATMVAYFIGRATGYADGSIGREFERASEVNRELGDEQRRELENNRGAIDAAEKLRRITAETNSTMRKLGGLNRQSISLSEEAVAQARILANYIKRVNGIIGNESDNSGSE